jgi:hypothetical protein
MRLLPAAAVLVWLAMMAFFAAVVAPAAFATLDREAAGRFVSAIFPRSYAVGAALGGLALAAFVARTLSGRGRPGDWLPLLLLLVMLAATLYAWLVVLPAAHAAREALRTAAPASASSGPAMAFARLHRLSGILNGVTMLTGVLVLIALGVRR